MAWTEFGIGNLVRWIVSDVADIVRAVATSNVHRIAFDGYQVAGYLGLPAAILGCLSAAEGILAEGEG